MTDTVRIRVTNRGIASQGFYALGARRLVRAGETLESVEMTAAEWDTWVEKRHVSAELVEGSALRHHETLLGSSTLDAVLAVGDREITLGELVRLVHSESGLSVSEWNDLDDDARDDMLHEALATMRTEAMPEPEGDEPAPAEYISKHRGAGSYSVMLGDEEVVSGLDKETSVRFNGMDPQEQARFVADRTSED